MKKHLLVILATFYTVTLFAQTDVPDGGAGGPMGGGSWLRFATGGNGTSIIENWGLNFSGTNNQPVKIRNTSLLVGYTSGSQDFGVGNAFISGNLGIGVNAAGNKLVVLGAGNLVNFTNGADQDLQIQLSSGGVSDKRTLLAPSTPTSFALGISGQEKMRINANGNLLIGQTSQNNSSYKLDVAGSVRANSIVVNTTGADFVFARQYKYMTLTNLKTYIIKNHHLPGVAPASKMITDGVDLASLNTKLLQKVEELTLYCIDLQNQVNKLKRNSK